ncbi:serine protease [bacterium]|nr:serine protease [bacterium]
MRSLLSACIFVFLFHSVSFAISIDDLSKTVVFLRQQSQQKVEVDGKLAEVWFRYPGTEDFKPMIKSNGGSGFILRYKKRDYLVTAKHVAESLSPTGEIVMNLPEGKSASITFQWLLQENIIKGAHWFHHPKADISVHPVAYNNSFDILAISEDLYPKQATEIILLNSAYIVGFPLGLGVLEKLSPVAKEAKVASKLTSIDNPSISPDLHFILLDQALSQGYSGAPVFYIEDIMSGISIGNQQMKGGEKLHLLGLQSSALSDKTGGKFSLVVPISYIWDILESQEFRTYENKLETKE